MSGRFEVDSSGCRLEGRGRVARLLDAGGMGSVYLAHDECLRGRSVVVKAPH